MQYLKAKLTRALFDHFGDDDRRIDHALTVTKWAEQICQAEGGDIDIVVAVGLLHDVGIKPAEEKFGYNNGKLQEEFGPPVAEAIMQKLGMPEDQITEACAIIGAHHTSAGVPSRNFPILWDADMIVNLGDDMPDAPREKLESIIEKRFRTHTGKKIAKTVLLK